MQQFQSTSRVIRSIITSSKHVRQISKPVNPLSDTHKPSRPCCLSHIAGVRYPTSVNGYFRKDSNYLVGGICNQFQKRPFLGCGDGEEGGVLSKVYEERIVLGYSPEQLLDVVAAVDLYHGFVPWCQRQFSETFLFDHLINTWEFKPGPVPGSCDLYFLVDFKFQSPIYRQVASMFFKEVVSRLVGSFGDRCRLIYGPGVPIVENAMQERV